MLCFARDPAKMVHTDKRKLSSRRNNNTGIHLTKKKRKQKKPQPPKHLQTLVNTVVGSLKTRVAKSVKGAKTAALRALLEWLSHISPIPTPPTPLPPPLPRCVLPPAKNDEMKTIILDLDETLVHSSEAKPSLYDFCIKVSIEEQDITFYVLKRPGLERLLLELSARFELVLFTASLRVYAEAVLQEIDPMQLIRHRLFRDSCKVVQGTLVKDLDILGRDLGRLVIVDDNPNAYFLHPSNAIPISPFVDDMNDRELFTLLEFFHLADNYEDLRDCIRNHIVLKP